MRRLQQIPRKGPAQRAGPTQGLTVPEVLVALAIFLIVGAVVLGTLPGLLGQGSRAAAEQTVVVGAKRYLEGVRAQFSVPAGFDAPLPAVPDAASLGGWTCQASQFSELDGPDGAGAPGSLRTEIRRVTLACAHPRQGAQSFAVSFGRPP